MPASKRTLAPASPLWPSLPTAQVKLANLRVRLALAPLLLLSLAVALVPVTMGMVHDIASVWGGSLHVVALRDGVWRVDLEIGCHPVTAKRRPVSRTVIRAREDAEIALAGLS